MIFEDYGCWFLLFIQYFTLANSAQHGPMINTRWATGNNTGEAVFFGCSKGIVVRVPSYDGRSSQSSSSSSIATHVLNRTRKMVVGNIDAISNGNIPPVSEYLCTGRYRWDRCEWLRCRWLLVSRFRDCWRSTNRHPSKRWEIARLKRRRRRHLIGLGWPLPGPRIAY